MVLNITFNIISAISRRSVLLVDETGVPEKTTDKLSHNVVKLWQHRQQHVHVGYYFNDKKGLTWVYLMCRIKWMLLSFCIESQMWQNKANRQHHSIICHPFNIHIKLTRNQYYIRRCVKQSFSGRLNLVQFRFNNNVSFIWAFLHISLYHDFRFPFRPLFYRKCNPGENMWTCSEFLMSTWKIKRKHK